MMKEPTEESFWQTFAREFMDTEGPDGMYPASIPFPYTRLRWVALTRDDNVEKLRQLLDAQTNPEAATHALEMILRRGSRSNPPLRCLRECIFVRGASTRFRSPQTLIRLKENGRGVCVELAVAWRVAYLWRKVRAICRLRHQLINLYECVCTPERVDFAADLAAATDGLYAT